MGNTAEMKVCLQPRGFTLIEVTVVLMVVGIIGFISLQFLTRAVDSYALLRDRNILYSEAAAAMEKMGREIRDAQSIRATVSSPGKIRVWKGHQTPLDTNLYVTYALNGTTLQRGSSSTDTDPSTYRDLASNCTSFAVSNSSNEIQLTMTLSQSGGATVTMKTKIYPKNLPFAGGVIYSGRNFAGDWEEEIQ
jgi:prepilin-type N-terminal cleavage/methylation domain-containing protein